VYINRDIISEKGYIKDINREKAWTSTCIVKAKDKKDIKGT
jgi:hypothetical protein